MNGHALPVQFEDGAQRHLASQLGMWVFLASEMLFFGVLFFVYAVTRLHYGDAFIAAGARTDLVLGSINTAVLLSSSLTMALAVHAAEGPSRRLTSLFLALTFLLGATFLSLKLVEYRHDFASHLVPGAHFALPEQGAELFFSLYFVMTAWHALHLVVGLAIVALIGVRAHRGAFDGHDHAPIELGGLYWHLVDIVWIFFYPLLYLVGRQ